MSSSSQGLLTAVKRKQFLLSIVTYWTHAYCTSICGCTKAATNWSIKLQEMHQCKILRSYSSKQWTLIQYDVSILSCLLCSSNSKYEDISKQRIWPTLTIRHQPACNDLVIRCGLALEIQHRSRMINHTDQTIFQWRSANTDIRIVSDDLRPNNATAWEASL